MSFLKMHIDTHARLVYLIIILLLASCEAPKHIVSNQPRKNNHSNGAQMSREAMNFDWLCGNRGLDVTCMIAPMREAVLS